MGQWPSLKCQLFSIILVCIILVALNFYHYMKGQKEKEVRKPQVFISFLG